MNFIFKVFLLVVALSVSYGSAAAVQKSPVVHPLFSSSSIVAPKTSQVQKKFDAPCDENQLNYCVQSYAKALNLTEMPSSATAFSYYIIGMVINQGLPGFEGLCKATNDFIDCLGPSYDSCLSISNLESIGVDADDATVYATLAAQMRYECGPAYEIFVDHFGCALADMKTKTFQIIYCIQTFNASVYSDPTKMCTEIQTFNQCYQNIFSNCGADFTAVLCETMAVTFDVTMPQCSLDCAQTKLMQIKQKFASLKSNKKNLRK